MILHRTVPMTLDQTEGDVEERARLEAAVQLEQLGPGYDADWSTWRQEVHTDYQGRRALLVQVAAARRVVP